MLGKCRAAYILSFRASKKGTGVGRINYEHRHIRSASAGSCIPTVRLTNFEHRSVFIGDRHA